MNHPSVGRFSNSHQAVKPPRRHDLDWLRVLAVICLLFFHSGMLFVAEWGWHIKNDETSSLFLEWMYFMSGWRMSLLFVISGAGTWFALGFRSGKYYLRERAKRLLIPLLFGIAVVVPPQIYFERLFNGQIESGYLSFWASVFQGVPYPEGNTSWHHLWFVLYLFLFSLLALPLFMWIRRGGLTILERLADLPGPALLLTFGLPYALVYALLTIPWPGPQNLIDDWGRFGSYLILFIYGFIWLSRPKLGDAINQHCRLALGWGIIGTIALNVMRWNDLEFPWGLTPEAIGYMTLRGMTGFCWMVAILGYARRLLTHSGPLLRYANRAVYPFYILHQTVIVILGYYVVQTSDTIAMKFLFVSLGSGFISIAVYEFLIRPYRIPCLLFGVKPAPRSASRRKGGTTSATNPALAATKLRG